MIFKRSSSPTSTLPDYESAEYANSPLMSLRSVEKSFQHGVSQTYVLRRINVDIKRGEFVSIMGPSGAGK